MTLLASSHWHVADVGGTCCWHKGIRRQARRWAGALVARTCWHKSRLLLAARWAALVASSLRDEGAVTSPSLAKNCLAEKAAARLWTSVGPTIGPSAMHSITGAGVACPAGASAACD